MVNHVELRTTAARTEENLMIALREYTRDLNKNLAETVDAEMQKNPLYAKLH